MDSLSMSQTTSIASSARENSNIRNSNVELLRLLCMFFILIHHFLVHGLSVAGYKDLVGNEFINQSSFFLDSFCFCAVNVFVLISGYFGIKLKFKSFAILYLQCFFYGGLCYFWHLFIDGAHIGRSLLSNTLFIFSSKSCWWFVAVYVYLMLLSPLLNKVVEHCSKREFQWILLLLTVLNVYFGFGWNGVYNADGYNISQFIYLYLIGRYIYIYTERKSNWKYRLKCLGGYVSLSLLMGIIGYVDFFYLRSSCSFLNVHVYNNPLLIMSSIALLMFMLTFSFQSKVINWLSASSLAIYLLHDQCYTSSTIYGAIGNLCAPLNSQYAIYLMLILLALIFMAACIAFDKVRIFITAPIVSWLNKHFDKWYSCHLSHK